MTDNQKVFFRHKWAIGNIIYRYIMNYEKINHVSKRAVKTRKLILKNSHGTYCVLLCPLAMLADLEEQMDAIPLPKPTEGVTKPGRYLVTTTETCYFLSKYCSND